MLNVAGDIRGRSRLFFHGRCNRLRDGIDFEIRPTMAFIASTACVVADCTAEICAPISSVALAVWVARFLTSDATTAKPLPASPARAGLNGRIQRQQIRLARDRADHVDDFADARRGFGKPLHALGGLVRILRRQLRDMGGLFDLLADFVDRSRQFTAACATTLMLAAASSVELATCSARFWLASASFRSVRAVPSIAAAALVTVLTVRQSARRIARSAM